MKGRFVLMSLFFLSVSLSAAAVPVTILYTNDLHLHFERFASLERLIDHERDARGTVLLLDAGDAWHDFRRPLAAVWGAAEMVSWMNRVGYDAMALGNHDLYWGAERLEALVERAEFPILCANLRPIPPVTAPFVASTVLRTEGVSVLTIGLITSEFLPYSAYPWFRYHRPVPTLREEMGHFGEDYDLIVVVGHLPVTDAMRIAAMIPGIDVFITGHSHQKTPIPVTVGETLVVQSGAFGKALGRLVLEVDPATGRHRLIEHTLLPTEKAPTDIDQGLRQIFRVVLAIVAVLLLVLR